MVDTPKSLIEHEHKYVSNSWKQYSLADLGQWVHLLVKRSHHRSNMAKRAKDLHDAQNYLNMMQAHIDAAVVTQPNELLAELPMQETTEPKLQYSGLAEVTEAIAEPEPEGIVYGDDGKVIAISAQEGERGYDPDAHEKQIRIFCDDKHIETAHTADVEAGTVKYYYRNEKNRMKTGTHTGKVEIRVHIPDGEAEIPGN